MPLGVLRDEQVDQRERRQHQERLQHLGQEGQADQGAGEGQPAHRVPGVGRRLASTARSVAAAEPTSSSTSRASGLLKRNISTATGVSARTAPAISPAAADPVVRRTTWCSSADRARRPRAPAAPGCSTREAEDPDRQRHRPQRQRRLVDGDRVAASEEPKKNAFHDSEPACTAAA